MTSHFNEELGDLRSNDLLQEEIVQSMFDKALESANHQRLKRILNTYSREYLDKVLVGYPDYLDEILEEEK